MIKKPAKRVANADLGSIYLSTEKIMFADQCIWEVLADHYEVF